MPAMAIGMSVTSMVAQNLGANQYNRVKEIVKYSVRITILFSILFFIIIYGFPKIVSSIFTTEPEVIGHTLKYIRIVSFTYFLFPIMFVLQGIVRGAGDTMTMLLFSLISLILFRYPTAYILSKYTLLQECGIWVGILLSSFVGVTLNYLYYISGKWQKSIIKQFAD
jgi:Na+-driven multidrug efflux pump